MAENNKRKSISESIKEKIRKGEIKMTPRVYFALKAMAIGLGVLMVVLFALYLVSFIIFGMRTSGVWFLPVFGFPGLGLFFRSLPWVLIVIALVLIAVLEFFARHFTFAYKKPALYSLIFIIVFVMIVGFAINETRFHSDLFLQAQEGPMPFVEGFYRDKAVFEPTGVYQGIVTEVNEGSVVIETPQGTVLTTIIGKETKIPPSEDIKQDDPIVVFGERDNGNIRAFGIRKIKNDFKTPFKNRPPKPFRH